jgi:hypothetical protein
MLLFEYNKQLGLNFGADGLGNMANELDELIVAKGRDELNKHVVASPMVLCLVIVNFMNHGLDKVVIIRLLYGLFISESIIRRNARLGQS